MRNSHRQRGTGLALYGRPAPHPHLQLSRHNGGVTLTGAGDEIFSAGHDAHAMQCFDTQAPMRDSLDKLARRHAVVTHEGDKP